MAKFELKQEHITLISRLNFRTCVNTVYHDRFTPEIDCKRPFGNGGTTKEVLRILNYPYDENTGEYVQEDINIAEQLLIELPVALEIIMQKHSFEPGIYDVNDYGAYCQYKYLRNYIALTEPLKEIEKQLSDSDDKEKIMRQLNITCMNVSGTNPWKVIEDLEWLVPTDRTKKIIEIFKKYEERRNNTV